MFGAIVGSLLGARTAAKASRANQREATAANVDAMKHRHQWEVDDLKAAGLNPILSAGGQGTGGMPAATGAPVPDYGATITNALQTSSNVDKQSAEIGQINALTNLTEQQKEVAIQQTNLLKEQIQKTFQETRGISFDNANEYDRTIFLQNNPDLLKFGAAMRELGVRGDALAGIISTSLQMPFKTVKNIFSKMFGSKKGVKK
jgi:hypothetical protein